MIQNLLIRNFAILAEIEIDFNPGLTVITGETGAGKSIILQALSVALGAKGSKTMVRSGMKRAVVETEVDQKTYRRLIHSRGRNKAFIDDTPLTETQFREAATTLADFHGQHEHQLIMNNATHIDYLDSYCGLQHEVEKISNIFRLLKVTGKELSTAIEIIRRSTERKELLDFQLKEISAINPQKGEDVLLDNQYKTLKHIDEMIETVRHLNRGMVEDDHSVYTQLSSAVKELEQLLKYDSQFGSYLNSLNTAAITVQDACAGLVEHINMLDHDKNHLIEIEERLQALEGLKRKYGGSLDSVLLAEKEIKRELTNLMGLDTRLDTLSRKISNLEKQYQILADHLHNARRNYIEKLSTAIEKEMEQLNMPAASFQIQLTQKPEVDSFVRCNDIPLKALPRGYDQVEFLLSTNPGESPKPLTQIASGGEISRIMLAIKSVFHRNDPVDTLVFDEVDVGISGVAAEKVADSLVNLSKSKQVICITHLPQIATRADHHLHVTKAIQASETKVSVRYLTKDERIQVIAQLFSGERIPDESLQSVKSFIETAHG